jgi:branched-chain amino acid transport system substrate-binding protein
VKNRILFISLAVVLAISLGLVGCTGAGPTIPPKPSVVTVGMSRDVTGFFEMAAFGPTYRAYFADLNAAGGIHLKQYDAGGVNCTVPIEVVRRDDHDDPAQSAENINLLIDVDKVDFLFGGCGTSHIFSQAPIANLRQYVLLTAEGGATDLKTSLPGMPYVFVNLSFSDWYQIPVLAKLLDEAHYAYCGAHNATAYITYIGLQHGVEYNSVAETYFPANNITIVGSSAHSPTTTDFSDIILDAKDLNVDIFCAFTYPACVWAITQEAITQDFNPKAFVCGPGANFGLYADPGTSGLNITEVEGVMSFAIGNYDTNGPGMDAMLDRVAYQIEEELDIPHGLGIGQGFLDWWGQPIYWATLQIWQHAVEAVGYVSQDKLKDELRSYNSEANGVDTVLGKTWYTIFGSGGGILAYQCHTGEIGQWINGVFEVIGYGKYESPKYTQLTSDLPRYVVTEDYVYPKTPFP